MKIKEEINNDFPPIEDSQEWINMANNVKKEYSVDGIHILDYETDNPLVVMYKWGYEREIIWSVAPSYKILLRQPSNFRTAINYIMGKIKKNNRAIKAHFDKDFNLYERMKKITNIITEEISGFVNEIAPVNLNNNEKAIVNDILSETLDEAIDLNKAFAKVKRYAAKGLITAAIFMALANSNAFGQDGMKRIKYIIDTSKPKTELVGTQTANWYWQGRSYQRILDDILKQGGFKVNTFHENNRAFLITLDTTDSTSVEKIVNNIVKFNGVHNGNEIIWKTMRDAAKPDDGKGFSIVLNKDNNGRIVLQFNSNSSEPALVDLSGGGDFQSNPDYLTTHSDKL
jgi:hypothetical protein